MGTFQREETEIDEHQIEHHQQWRQSSNTGVLTTSTSQSESSDSLDSDSDDQCNKMERATKSVEKNAENFTFESLLMLDEVEASSNPTYQKLITLENGMGLYAVPGKNAPIVSLDVRNVNNLPKPHEMAEWKNVPVNLDGQIHVYYAVANDKLADPIVELRCVHRDEAISLVNNEQYKKVSTPLRAHNGTENFIVFKRLSDCIITNTQRLTSLNSDSSPAAEFSSAVQQFQVNDMVDCKDNSGNWLEARVISINTADDSVFIGYEGMADRWREWIPIKSKRLAPFHTKVSTVNDKLQHLRIGTIEPFLQTIMPLLSRIVESCHEQFERIRRTSTLNSGELSALTHKDLLSVTSSSSLPRLSALLTTQDLRTLTVQENIRLLSWAMYASLENVQQFELVYRFIRYNILITCYALVSEPAGDLDHIWLDSLSRIFDISQVKLYAISKRVPDQIWNPMQSDDKLFLDPPAAPLVSPDTILRSIVGTSIPNVFIRNVNIFGICGGFEGIRKHLTSSNIRIGLLIPAVQFMLNIRSVVDTNFFKPYIASLDLTSVTRQTLDNLSDEDLKTLEKSTLFTLFKNIGVILMSSSVMLTSAEWIETAQLSYALRMLRAKTLATKLAAIEQLDHTARTLFAKHKQRQRSNGISADAFAKWLNENKVFEVVTGRDSHEEVLKRSSIFYSFCAAFNKLDSRHIDMLYAAAYRKHEGILRNVLDVLIDAANSFSLELLDCVYERYSKKTVDEWKVIDVDFIKRFSMNVVREIEYQKKGALLEHQRQYGTDLLWNLVQANTALPFTEIGTGISALEISARTALSELLALPELRHLCTHYIKLCLDTLLTKDDNRVDDSDPIISFQLSKSVANILLMQSIFSKLSEVGNRYSTGQAVNLADLLVQFEADNNLMNVLFEDLIGFHSIASAFLKSKKSAYVSLPLVTDYVIGKMSHSEQIGARFTLIMFVITHSCIPFTNEHIDNLWHVFVEDALTVTDQIRFFSQICFMAENPKDTAFGKLSSQQTKYLFEQLLCNPQRFHIATLNVKGYEAFEVLFTNVNYAAGSVASVARHALRVIAPSKLIGLGALWELAIHANDPMVSSHASHYLISCFLRMDTTISSENRRFFLQSFVDKCMKMITQLRISATEEANNARSLRRLIELLRKFIERLGSDEVPEKPRYNVGCLVKVSNPRIPSYLLDAHVVQCNPDGTYQIRYIDSDLEETRTERMLTACNERKYPDLRNWDLSSTDAYYARFIIPTNDLYYDTLIDLLASPDHDVASNALQILQQLPKSDHFRAQIDRLGVTDFAADFDSILPANAPAKLLFTLNLIRDQLMPILEYQAAIVDRSVNAVNSLSDAPLSDSIVWCRTLFDKGGFKHVILLFQYLTLDNALSQNCLQVLVDIVWYCVSTPMLRKLVSRAVSFQQIAIQMIDLVLNGVRNSSKLDLYTSDNNAQQLQQSFSKVDSIIKVPLECVAACLQYSPDLADFVIGRVDWTLLITEGLLHDSSVLRASLRQGICAFAMSSSVACRSALSSMLSQLSSIDPVTQSQCCLEFFDVLGQLLHVAATCSSSSDALKVTVDQQRFDASCSSLFSSCITTETELKTMVAPLLIKFRSHPTVELTFNGAPDFMLQGILDCLRQLAESMSMRTFLLEERLLPILLSDLFELPSQGDPPPLPPKAKTTCVREVGLQLLFQMVKSSRSALRTLADYCMPLHVNCSQEIGWNYEPRTEERNSTGYMGLQNLGCICYMNAPLQQFFMNPYLRRNLLAIDEFKDATNGDLRESLVYAVQRMMAVLQEGVEQSYSPSALCYAYKDSNGRPRDVRVQEDCGEFCQFLLDKLSDALKGTKHEHAINDIVQGSFAEVLSGKSECKHSRERPSVFVGVQLEIKNLHTLSDALDSLVSIETMEGDNAVRCDECGKKVDTTKRMCFKKLPPSLFFVLKRFNLDYDTLETVKLNDRLEFPMLLNMKPYTHEFLYGNSDATDCVPDTAYQYVLRGVVVHAGSAQGGHYYSFAQERGAGLEDGRWFKFNDSIVTPFNPSEIPQECFGGIEDHPLRGVRGANDQLAGGQTERFRNAYILFYDRLPTEEGTHMHGAIIENGRLRLPLSPTLQSEIWQSNLNFWRDRLVFDKTYNNYVLQVVDMEASQPLPTLPQDESDGTSSLLHYATFVLFNTVFRSREKDTLQEWAVVMDIMFARYADLSLWLIEQMANHSEWNEQLLIKCPEPEVRQVVSQLLLTAIQTQLSATDENFISIANTHVRLLIPWIEAALEQVQTAESFWRCLSHYSQSKALARIMCLEHNLFERLLSLYVTNWRARIEHWLNVRGRKQRVAINELDIPATQDVLACMAMLALQYQRPIISIDPSMIADLDTDEQSAIREAYLALETDNRSLLSLTPVIEKLLIGDGDERSLGFIGNAVSLLRNSHTFGTAIKMLKHWCGDNTGVTFLIIQQLFLLINQLDYDKLAFPLKAVGVLLRLQDKLTPVRLDWILLHFTSSIHSQAKYWKAKDFCLHYLIVFAAQLPTVYQWLHRHPNVIEPMIQWLSLYWDPLEIARRRIPGIQLLKYESGRNIPHELLKAEGYDLHDKQKLLEMIIAGTPLPMQIKQYPHLYGEPAVLDEQSSCSSDDADENTL